MKLREWFALRGFGYAFNRATLLLDRYGITPRKAAARIRACVEMLAEHGCAPTLPTPGCIVERYPDIIRRLQDAGAEIAVHGYEHVDLSTYSPHEASRQLVRAALSFARHGIEVHGFRCPYLRYTDELLDALPRGIFDYSSNQAIWWDVVPPCDTYPANTMFDALQRFYQPRPATITVCTPWMRSGLIEIPVSLPDDLQLHDGLQRDSEGMRQAWSQILRRTHRRGGLFVLGFHPELASRCQQTYVALLDEAEHFRPPVWIAKLHEVSKWWLEKSTFSVSTSSTPAGLHLSFNCSARATILLKGAGAYDWGDRWDGAYYELKTRDLHTLAEARPFVGLPSSVPKRVTGFLREQGYILDTSEEATRCGVYIDHGTLARLTSEVELISHIESSPGPLVRYWRWPRGARSAMCVTGDLDALTLLDYGSRLFAQ